MKNPDLHWMRLPLEGIENCRELGGYETTTGDQVRWRSFLRASDMNRATEEDIAFLKAYGVETVIDLRRDDEVDASPNPLAEESFCDYHNIPLFLQPLADMELSNTVNMGEFYVILLEETETLGEIFNVIAEAKPGTIVFHCMAGKDRTGVLAMLLLGIVGVKKKDIIANYETTYSHMESFHQEDLLPVGIPTEFLYSKREYLEHAYDYLIDKYGTFTNYLQTKGISQDVIEKVKERLVFESRYVR